MSMPNGNQQNERVKISDVVASLHSNIRSRVEDWLPGGKISSQEYIVKNPTRSDDNAGSFSINLQTGAWADFATGDSGGDLVSLYAYLHNLNNGQAANELAAKCGLNGTESPIAKPRTPEWEQMIPIPEGQKLPKGFPVKNADGSWSHERWTTIWAYKDAEGRIIGYVARFENGKKENGKVDKDFRPLIWAKNVKTGVERWKWQDFGKPYPLYGLDRLAANPTARVLIVEGEKCADAANEVLLSKGWVAISWYGAAGRAKSADVEPIKGRDCVGWADNDKPGMDAMTGVAERLGGIPIMKIPDGYPKGWDIADALSLDSVRQIEDVAGFIEECISEPDPVKKPVQVAANDNRPARYELTDTGDARRLYQLHRDDIKYMPSIDKFVMWDSKRWKILDNVSKVLPMAWGLPDDLRKQRAAYEKLAAEDRERSAEFMKIAEAFEKHSKKVQSTATIKNILFQLKAVPGIEISQHELDASPWLLNCRNGTVDLKRGEFREHRRSDYITKMIDVDYDPKADAPLWIETLNRFLPDPSVRSFFRRALGYSITGDMRERSYFICWGSGKNGKSTIVNAVLDLLGDYGAQADKGVFFERRVDSDISNGVARLRGCRFVSASENKDGAHLSVELIKQITGGDKITARFLHQEFFEFQPAMKIWLATNHRPRISDTNRAIWDRTLLIPFTVTIGDDEIDLDMGQKLKAERSGILNWLLMDCMAWQREGLNPPELVQTAIREYRESEDPIRGFLDERYDFVPHGSVGAQTLYNDYRSYCESSGLRAVSIVKFSKRLLEDFAAEFGIERQETRAGTREYKGLVRKPMIGDDDIRLAWVDRRLA